MRNPVWWMGTGLWRGLNGVEGMRLGRLKQWLHRIQIEEGLTTLTEMEAALSKLPTNTAMLRRGQARLPLKNRHQFDGGKRRRVSMAAIQLPEKAIFDQRVEAISNRITGITNSNTMAGLLNSNFKVALKFRHVSVEVDR